MNHPLVEIELGLDLFEAQLLTESVRSAGYDVRLLEMHDATTALDTTRQTLLVAERDQDAVRSIIDQSFELD